MPFEFILAAVTLLALLIAAYCDLKTREVPDWLNYGLVFAALGIRLIYSPELGWQLFISGVLGFLVCLGLAYLFYYTNQWGGGDSKLLMGMGAVIGITYPFNQSSFTLLFFFIALLLFGVVYGLLWMAGKALQKKRLFSRNFKKALAEQKKVHSILVLVSVALLVLGILYPLLLPLFFFPLGVFYLLLFVTTVEKSCFLKYVPINKLTEGDWLAEDVVIAGKRLLSKKTLEKKDLLILQDAQAKHNMKDVLIKEGVPFVPSFLLAYLFLLFGKGLIAGLFRPFLP